MKFIATPLIALCAILGLSPICHHSPDASADVPIRYGDFEQWIARNVKESKLLGGQMRTLYEVAPMRTWPVNTPYSNQGGSPWATSNVYAKVMGVVKGSVSVTPDTRPTGGHCARLTTTEVKCKALGIVNITVIAAGSLFLGHLDEPVTSSSNPMAKMDAGIPFTKRPRAIKFDYRVSLSNATHRLRETGTGKSTVSGRDECEALALLQRRWEDKKGHLHAHRVGTMWVRFRQSTNWLNNQEFAIHYGDISQTSYYKAYMALQTKDSERLYHARNSLGKLEPVIEEGWGSASEQPTHLILYFNSSHGGAYVGSPGNTLWIDNVSLCY